MEDNNRAGRMRGKPRRLSQWRPRVSEQRTPRWGATEERRLAEKGDASVQDTSARRVAAARRLDTAYGLGGHGASICSWRRGVEAIANEKEVRAARRRPLGDDHDATVGTKDDFADVFGAQDTLCKGENLIFRCVVAIVRKRREAGGSNNPEGNPACRLWPFRSPAYEYIVAGNERVCWVGDDCLITSPKLAEIRGISGHSVKPSARHSYQVSAPCRGYRNIFAEPARAARDRPYVAQRLVEALRHRICA